MPDLYIKKDFLNWEWQIATEHYDVIYHTNLLKLDSECRILRQRFAL